MQITHVEFGCRSCEPLEKFYGGLLGFPVVARSDDSVSFQTGWTKLTFRRRDFSWPSHFAFNIPHHQILSAAHWLKQRLSLLTDDNDEEVFEFSSWQAKATYFCDPEGNRVEFIARAGMRSDVVGAFDLPQVIGLSEVGIPTENVIGLAEELRKRCALKPYGEHSEQFCPVGSPAGMLILVETGRLWFPDNAVAAVPQPVAMRFRDEEFKWFTLKFREEQGSIVRVSAGYDWAV